MLIALASRPASGHAAAEPSSSLARQRRITVSVTGMPEPDLYMLRFRCLLEGA